MLCRHFASSRPLPLFSTSWQYRTLSSPLVPPLLVQGATMRKHWKVWGGVRAVTHDIRPFSFLFLVAQLLRWSGSSCHVKQTRYLRMICVVLTEFGQGHEKLKLRSKNFIRAFPCLQNLFMPFRIIYHYHRAKRHFRDMNTNTNSRRYIYAMCVARRSSRGIPCSPRGPFSATSQSPHCHHMTKWFSATFLVYVCICVQFDV